MADALGEFILKRFTPQAARAMQEAIAQAGGHEVFFAGSLRSDGLVEAVRVCARGHAEAVPAVFESLGLRDVVIHNHPSGVLAPSDADLALAAQYTAHGHGVYIVDNDATRVYVVVEPFLPSQAQPLDAAALDAALAPGGPIAGVLPQFEVRPQQHAMMEAVIDAFNRDGVRAIEAPTGVGKTLAYLLPAARWALSNKERVAVSTRTINLQEQIVFKDVPVLEKALGQPVTACLVKGRGNYLCPRKLERALSEATLFDEGGERERLEAIAEWAARTEDGSLSDLPLVPGRELWDRVCSEADTCSVARCPDPKRCFVGKARRAAARADLLVVNHHMLFSDLAIKQEQGDFAAMAVLPSYKRVVFDEAHSIEDSATAYFGVQATRGGAAAVFSRLHRIERGRERGVLHTIAQRLRTSDAVSITQWEGAETLLVVELLPQLAVARDAVEAAFDALRALTALKAPGIGREIKWRLTEAALADPQLRRVHESSALPAVEALERLAALAIALHNRVRDCFKDAEEFPADIAADLQELQAYAARLQRIGLALGEMLGPELAPNTVRWIEVDASNDAFIRIARCPLHVGAPMAEWVYANLSTVVMTSATLCVARRFDYLYDRLGIDRLPPARAGAVQLDSPFDYAAQALLAIATGLPDPGAPDFVGACIPCIREILRITRGHAFVLFTSFSALDATHRALRDELAAAGIVPLRQGEASRTHLLDRFRAAPSSVLFATDSFWEGVDVAGEALQCVILTKLPFRVPTEPVLEARTEALERAGRNAFAAYSLPMAVIKFRQGFGRLIRRRTDRGAVVVLDKRIVSKYYGRHFVDSLPPVGVVRAALPALYDSLRQFFAAVPPADRAMGGADSNE